MIERTHRLKHGDIFAIFLACDALRHGYQATIYTYNLQAREVMTGGSSGLTWRTAQSLFVRSSQIDPEETVAVCFPKVCFAAISGNS
ncbi:MAG: hypothetical protein Q8K12_01285 [Thiobacillus sp.]|nr:hypothetical protein [Thiobacillus sp.]